MIQWTDPIPTRDGRVVEVPGQHLPPGGHSYGRMRAGLPPLPPPFDPCLEAITSIERYGEPYGGFACLPRRRRDWHVPCSRQWMIWAFLVAVGVVLAILL
jgi:hypothetical protein